MLCPEGYFTPRMLEETFRNSLERESVRKAIYLSAGHNVVSVADPHLKTVLDAAARIFLHLFVGDNTGKARLCCPQTARVMRVDPWAASTLGTVVSDLPQTAKSAESAIAKLDKDLTFIDQELWVLDFHNLDRANDQKGGHQRLACLLQWMDGWSLCFPAEVFPSDVGKSMNEFAVKMVRERTITQIHGRKAGRPGKVDKLVRWLTDTYPDGTIGQPAKVLRQMAQDALSDTFGDTSMRNAIRNFREAR